MIQTTNVTTSVATGAGASPSSATSPTSPTTSDMWTAVYTPTELQNMELIGASSPSVYDRVFAPSSSTPVASYNFHTPAPMSGVSSSGVNLYPLDSYGQDAMLVKDVFAPERSAVYPYSLPAEAVSLFDSNSRLLTDPAVVTRLEAEYPGLDVESLLDIRKDYADKGPALGSGEIFTTAETFNTINLFNELAPSLVAPGAAATATVAPAASVRGVEELQRLIDRPQDVAAEQRAEAERLGSSYMGAVRPDSVEAGIYSVSNDVRKELVAAGVDSVAELPEPVQAQLVAAYERNTVRAHKENADYSARTDIQKLQREREYRKEEVNLVLEAKFDPARSPRVTPELRVQIDTGKEAITELDNQIASVEQRVARDPSSVTPDTYWELDGLYAKRDMAVRQYNARLQSAYGTQIQGFWKTDTIGEPGTAWNYQNMVYMGTALLITPLLALLQQEAEDDRLERSHEWSLEAAELAYQRERDLVGMQLASQERQVAMQTSNSGTKPLPASSPSFSAPVYVG